MCNCPLYFAQCSYTLQACLYIKHTLNFNCVCMQELSGPASPAEYSAVLRTLTYEHLSANPGHPSTDVRYMPMCTCALRFSQALIANYAQAVHNHYSWTHCTCMFTSIMYVTYTYIHTNMYTLYVHFCVSVCNTSAFTFPQSAVVHSRRRSNGHKLDIYFECMCSVNKKDNA